MEELAARAEEQHLDADVEVPAHKTWRVEGVVAVAADAAPEQVNSFVQSKTEVFEKIEESLRPLFMVEDLNDDEIMELCILSNELNACEATAILRRSLRRVQRGCDSVKVNRVCSGFDNCKSQRNNVGPQS